MDPGASSHGQELIEYPKISQGDTVFKIEWIQAPFSVSDKGALLCVQNPSAKKAGFFVHSDSEPLHIFMPATLRTEKVGKANPSYSTVKSNVKIDGYYDRAEDCIVLTTYDLDIKYREYPPTQINGVPLVNRQDLVFEPDGTTLKLEMQDDVIMDKMIIQLAGCATVEKVSPISIRVGEFIGSRCEEKLLDPYHQKRVRGILHQKTKSHVWNALPGPIAEEINASFEERDKFINTCNQVFRDIESNIKNTSFYLFRDKPGDKSTEFYGIETKGIIMKLYAAPIRYARKPLVELVQQEASRET